MAKMRALHCYSNGSVDFINSLSLLLLRYRFVIVRLCVRAREYIKEHTVSKVQRLSYIGSCRVPTNSLNEHVDLAILSIIVEFTMQTFK